MKEREFRVLQLLCEQETKSFNSLCNLALPTNYAIFMLLQLRAAKRHPLNKSDACQRRLNALVTALEKYANDLGIEFTGQGLKSEWLIGATFSDLTMECKEQLADQRGILLTLASALSIYKGLDIKTTLDAATISYIKDKDLLRPSQIDAEVESLQGLPPVLTDKLGNSEVPRPYAWGFFYSTSCGNMGFHISGQHDLFAVAKTSIDTLKRIYPEVNWVIVKSIG
ncbi:MAG: hypothetical protein F6K31_15035 [Symploca sp. SIO2G7]|nr:hypothetical protein [Symploca sp. SIO2G7]